MNRIQMNRIQRAALTAAAAAAALLGLSLAASPARAQFYVSKDMTIDFPFGPFVIVGTGTGDNRTSPTLTVVNGAQLFNGLSAVNASTVNMSGGWSFILAGEDESRLFVSGGTVEGTLTASDRGTWTVSGGTVGQIHHDDFGSATGTLRGGAVIVSNVSIRSGQLAMLGGTV